MIEALTQLADTVRAATGIKIGPAQHGSLAAAAARVAPGMDQPQLLQALHQQPDGRALLRRLIDEVTVNETFFFRHVADLAALDWPAMLAGALAARSPVVRVWVAGCSTGEEAYTLAILASEAFAPGPAPVSILATDINDAVLAAGERGCYGARAVRGVEPARRDRYFTPQGSRLVVGPELRRLVRFKRHNLVRDPVPPPSAGPFELVSCRNTLIYFEPETVDRVIRALERALSPTGSLILGAADRISATPGSTSSSPKPVRTIFARPAERPVALRPVRRLREPSSPLAPRDGGIAGALAAADAGRLDLAAELAAEVLAADPLNAEAQFVRGLAELGQGNARAAIESLRRALYVRPDFGIAAFKLGRAHELCGEPRAATQAYKQAVHALETSSQQPGLLDEPVAAGDVAAACRVRLRALAARPDTHRRQTSAGRRT